MGLCSFPLRFPAHAPPPPFFYPRKGAGARLPHTQVDHAANQPPSTEEVYAAAEAEERIIQDKQKPPDPEDTDADSDAEPAGSGPKGNGPPLTVGSFERKRELCDGGGICSVGRWPPWSRPETANPRLHAIRDLGLRGVRLWAEGTGCNPDEIFDRLAEGGAPEDPIPGELLDRLAEDAMRLFDADADHARPRPEDREQLIRVRLLRCLLRAAGDPDPNGMLHYCRGVRLGVNCKLPRTPAVYERKVRWRLQEQYQAQEHYGQSVEGVWRTNYKSVDAHLELIDRQLCDHVARGLAIRLTPEEAHRQYPNMTVVSLGAVAKTDAPKDMEDIRLVMDGTHGVTLNSRIKPRDRDRCPTAGDVKRLQREQARDLPAVGLAVDVREAHRLPPVHHEDWHHQACRSHHHSDIVMYKYCVFGFASSAYWWSRLGGAILRILLLLAPREASLWLLLLADDLKVESTSRAPRPWVLWVIVMMRLLGVPLAWKKIQGGREITWIGFSIRLLPLAVGISESRARWATEWLLRAARDGSVDVGELRSAVGRLSFVTNALEYERPFLSPLYSFLSLHPGSGIRSLPVYVRLVMQYLAMRLGRRRFYPSAESRCSQAHPFRVDAHAEGNVIGVGGWRPTAGTDGQISLASSPWFALSLDKGSAPWAYQRGQPYRAIASLEALAALLGIVAFSDTSRTNEDSVLVVPGLTDNRANKYALSHLQSTKFPLVVVLMELACQLDRKSQRLHLTWTPREMNAEADQLANGDTTGFSPELRVNMDLHTMPWIVLGQLMDQGMEFERERNLAPPPRAKPKASKRKRTPFKERQPW